MSLFSKLFKREVENQTENPAPVESKSQKLQSTKTKPVHTPVEPFSPHPILISAYQKSQGIDLLTPLSNTFLNLANTPSIHAEDLAPVINKLSLTLEKIKGKIKAIDSSEKSVLTLIANCSSLQTLIPPDKTSTYDSYFAQNDFQALEQEWAILNTYEDFRGNAQEEISTEILSLKASLQELFAYKTELEAFLTEFLKQDQKLRTDIEVFVKTVNEAKSKFKLSPDWEGKKQPLIAYGTQLENRRAEFLAKEKEVNIKIKALYEAFPQVHAEFQNHADLFSVALQEKLKQIRLDSTLIEEKVKLISQQKAVTEILTSINDFSETLLY